METNMTNAESLLAASRHRIEQLAGTSDPTNPLVIGLTALDGVRQRIGYAPMSIDHAVAQKKAEHFDKEQEEALASLCENGELTAEAILRYFSQIDELAKSDNPVDLRNAELYRKAFLSKVTGLPNRVVADAVVENRIRDGKPSVNMFVDLTNFKAINDIRGFVEGDDALEISGLALDEVAILDQLQRVVGQSAGLISGSLRAEQKPTADEKRTDKTPDRDIVCHTGGDEFAAILSDLNEEQITEVTRRVAWNVVTGDAYRTIINALTTGEKKVNSIGLRIGAVHFGGVDDGIKNASEVTSMSDPKTAAKQIEIHCKSEGILLDTENNMQPVMSILYADVTDPEDVKIYRKVGDGELQLTDMQYEKDDWINPRDPSK